MKAKIEDFEPGDLESWSDDAIRFGEELSDLVNNDMDRIMMLAMVAANYVGLIAVNHNLHPDWLMDNLKPIAADAWKRLLEEHRQ